MRAVHHFSDSCRFYENSIDFLLLTEYLLIIQNRRDTNQVCNPNTYESVPDK